LGSDLHLCTEKRGAKEEVQEGIHSKHDKRGVGEKGRKVDQTGCNNAQRGLDEGVEGGPMNKNLDTEGVNQRGGDGLEW